MKVRKPHLGPKEMRVAVGALIGQAPQAISVHAVLVVTADGQPYMQATTSSPQELLSFLAGAQLSLMRRLWWPPAESDLRVGLSLQRQPLEGETAVTIGGIIQQPPAELASYIALAVCENGLVVQTCASDEEMLTGIAGYQHKLMVGMWFGDEEDGEDA